MRRGPTDSLLLRSRLSERLEARERAYSLRVLIGLAFALSLCLLLTRLPWYPKPRPIGWQLVEEDRRLALLATQLEARAREDAGVPITRFAPPEPEEKKEGRDTSELKALQLRRRLEPPARLLAREVIFENPEQPPQIIGGLGAYYIHIEYPEEAIRAGIEGRLVLRFVVETDGRPSNIRVIQPLHPLLDSAAVAALRRVRFIPGKQNGQPVRVRMQLPVRFRLLSSPVQANNDNGSGR
ncbi:energy transducer TonB [Rhodothermus marinus]|uniref:TonB family protein n=1 Tax=Rhodothermus marinus (strain ATCC 43812 / DSM 4252 / R-10) TaxID=518766 RepID=D0MIK1_RHOM4|nr:energy transducer TonB [Rhodothermus marinus]ACY48309.1 TonB family protein [Rhodothermus marinus DSM 4252]